MTINLVDLDGLGKAYAQDEARAPQETIRIVAGQIHLAVEVANQVLAAHSPRLFSFGGTLVHVERIADGFRTQDGQTVPAQSVLIEQASPAWLQLELCRLIQWMRPKERNGTISWVPDDPPMPVVGGILADRAQWQVPILAGTTEIPILRHDGSICAAPRYDRLTGLYYDPNGATFPDIPASPTREDALAALEVLREPLRDFPFVADCHMAAAVAMILTAVIRRQLQTAPGFAIDARCPGTGKGLLVDVATIVATGRGAPITPFTKDENEQRKRITSSLLAGVPVLNIDNVDAPLDSAAINSLLTAEIWKDRILGESKEPAVPTNVLVTITGNNLVIQGDMNRRLIQIELDAGVERPELRTFAVEDLKAWVKARRSQLAVAALTILSAWRRAGRPRPDGFVPLGSFEPWSLEIGACLRWLGLADPVETMERSRANDPKMEVLRRVLSAWWEIFGDAEQTIGAVLQALEPAPDGIEERPVVTGLRETFDEIAVECRSDRAKRVKIGSFVRGHAGRVVTLESGQAVRFAKGGIDRMKVTKWRVEGVVEAPNAGLRSAEGAEL